jgi:uncharacterized protein
MSLALVFGVLIGAVMGLTGAGGGILAVPLLSAGLGWRLQEAAPVALIAVATSAAFGAWLAWRRRQVRYRAAAVMAAAGVPFAAIGQVIAQHVPQRVLSGLFALILVVVAVRMWRSSATAEVGLVTQTNENDARRAQIDPATGRFIWNFATLVLFIAIGAMIGFLTGLLGVGGGFIMVPMLARYTRATMHHVIATSLLVIALVGSGSVLVSLARGVTIPLAATGAFTAACVFGMLIARYIADKANAKQIRIGFIVLLLLVAGFMTWRAQPFIHGSPGSNGSSLPAGTLSSG